MPNTRFNVSMVSRRRIHSITSRKGVTYTCLPSCRHMIRGDRRLPAPYTVTEFFELCLSIGVNPSSPRVILEMEKLNLRFGIRQCGHRGSRQCGRFVPTYLNQSAGGGRVGGHKPNIIHVLMFVKPIDHVPSEFDEICPFLDRQGEREVGRTRVGDPHEHAPKYHVYTSVKHEQQT